VNLRLAPPENSGPTCGLGETVARLQALIGVESISADYVRLRIGLLKAQAAVRSALAGRDRAGFASPEHAPGPGPHLGPGSIRWDTALLASMFDDLCAAVAESGRAADGLAGIRSAVRDQAVRLEELAEACAFGPEEDRLPALAEQAGIPRDVLDFIGRTLASPFVAEAAHRLRDQLNTSAEPPGPSGRCPMCGSAPALAWLERDGGQRILYCALCEQRWPFARLQCPFCGNRDQHTLGFLAIAGDEVHSAETCGKCRRYIKTVDEDKLAAGEEVIPLVEDAATLHLDLVAERDGYPCRLF
jgi:bacterioferritin-associated ferredoxin